MATVIRPVTYTGTMQRLVVTDLTAGSITVKLWGGGGGGGGNDVELGGSGSGSGYVEKTFSVVPGDIIDVAVGGAGTAGASLAGSAPGGVGGASYLLSGFVFNSRSPPLGPPAVYTQFNPAYVPWLNNYGVWEADTYAGIFDRTYTFTAPTTTTYTLISSCDNYGYVYIDGSQVLAVDGFRAIYQTTVSLSAGTHTIRTLGINTGGPGSMGTTLVIDNANDILDTRITTGTWGGVAPTITYSGWLPWFNEHAVSIPVTPWTYTINFPVSSSYVWQMGADYAMTVKIDGSTVASITDYTGSYELPSPFKVTQSVTAGNHTVEILPSDDGGTVGYALVIEEYNSNILGGAQGGNAGPSYPSGGGGGSGGATVVLLNGSVIAVAGGGGGGGGGGRDSAGQDAPGTAGRAGVGINSGQNGQNHPDDGGGAGAGGGGWGGGQGGVIVGEGVGGPAGSAGGSLGDIVNEPVGRFSTLGQYGIPGYGGLPTQSGQNGLAVFEFNISGLYVKDSGSWQAVQDTYVKANGSWSLVQETFVKQNGQWELVKGVDDAAPVFVSTGSNNFGIDSRSSDA